MKTYAKNPSTGEATEVVRLVLTDKDANPTEIGALWKEGKCLFAVKKEIIGNLVNCILNAEDARFTLPWEGCIESSDGYVIIDMAVEMNGEELTKKVYTGPFSAEIFGLVTGLTASGMTNGDSYTSGELEPDDGYGIKAITVQMGDDDVSESSVSGNTVSIASVYGDIVIDVETACQIVTNMFLNRVTGNGLDFVNSKAILKSIMGNTLVWNQMFNTWSIYGGGTTISKNGDDLIITTTAANCGVLQDITLEDEKKYYFAFELDTEVNGQILMYRGGRIWNHGLIQYRSPQLKYSIVIDATGSDVGNLYWIFRFSGAGTYTLRHTKLIDLTLMFGEGNEPTAEEFEAMFPNGTYDYQAATMLNFKGNSYVSKDTSSNVLNTVPLNITTLTGKLNGEGSSVNIFSDGMRSAGSVYDEISKVNGVWKATKRVDSRAYQSGDESDASVTSDGTNTNYALASPLVYVLDEDIQEILNVQVDGNESILPLNGSVPTTSPARLSIQYGTTS